MSEKNTEVINLLSQLNYQVDSIVSKILLKKDNGNVTLFAFDKGQGLTEHTSPYDALPGRRNCHKGKRK